MGRLTHAGSEHAQFLHWGEELWSYFAVVSAAEILREVVGQYVFSRAPVVTELFLVGPVAHPPVSHVC